MSIILNHVCFSYSSGTEAECKALDDVSFTIEDGEFIALLGHTGSGKSTLVQHLNALLKPTSGEIYYNGADIHDEDFDRRWLRSRVGLVFQYPEHQLFETDVFSDVCFGPRNLGLDKKEVELRAFTALKQVGIEDEYVYQSPFDLSGGQKRRVAIAGVLAMHPDVLILDEPTAGLDPRGRDELLELIKKLHEQDHITIILVSHSMEDVANYAKRLIVMDRGKIRFDGDRETVFSHGKELVEMGLAVPQVTGIMEELREAGIPVRTDIYTIEDAEAEILRRLPR